MSLELLVFLGVAALAVFASAFMLISRNAVHAALALVATMISLSYFYLILNAPFLAMVQITVYAGAIMVLFMFVIMLLGAEKLGELPTKYKLLPLIGVAVSGLFLFTAYFAIAQGNVGALKPVEQSPLVRVIHVGVNVPPVDLYLNTEKVAGGVTYESKSDFKAVKAGDYNILLYATKPDGAAIDPTKDAPAQAIAFSLKGGTALTVIATADKLIPVVASLGETKREGDFRYVVVNAHPESGAVNLIRYDPSNPNPIPEDRNRYIQILAPALEYGMVSAVTEIEAGDFRTAWEVKGERVSVPEMLHAEPNTAEIVILYPDVVAGSNPPRTLPNQFEAIDRIQPAFGGPNHIGENLFTIYLLPFELVSLLLLVAMVGAIVLTREAPIRRDRRRAVVSKGYSVRRLNQGASPQPTVPALSESKPNESSAD
jgi:NADH-quinone oxidoreductase subunit J